MLRTSKGADQKHALNLQNSLIKLSAEFEMQLCRYEPTALGLRKHQTICARELPFQSYFVCFNRVAGFLENSTFRPVGSSHHRRLSWKPEDESGLPGREGSLLRLFFCQALIYHLGMINVK